jgi:hypothetical protein
MLLHVCFRLSLSPILSVGGVGGWGCKHTITHPIILSMPRDSFPATRVELTSWRRLGVKKIFGHIIFVRLPQKGCFLIDLVEIFIYAL